MDVFGIVEAKREGITRMCMAGERWNQYLRSEEKEEVVKPIWMSY